MRLSAAFSLLLPLLFPTLLRADAPPCDIKPDVVYGPKMGMALTLDVIKPKTNANGAGILFMVSGGLGFGLSPWVAPEQMVKGDWGRALGFSAFLEKGYTLFLVRHGSSRLFQVPECVSNRRRCVSSFPRFSSTPHNGRVFRQSNM